MVSLVMGLSVVLFPVTILVGYALFFGDSRSSSMGGRVTYLVTCWLPPFAARSAKRVLGERGYAGVLWLVNYCFYRPNPLLQLMYSTLVLGGYAVLVWEAYPMIPNLYMASYHRWTGVIVWSFTVFSFVKACHKSPGVITEDTLARYDIFPYDNVLFVRRNCETCKTVKVARSKHCSVCDVCVPRFDHHCAWLNQCVGQENYRFFLLFLLSNSVMLLYGAGAMACVLLSVTTEKQLFSATFVNRITHEKIQASYGMVFQYLLSRYSNVVMLLILCGIMGVVVFCFFCYHIWLAGSGTTTNESSKWGDVGAYVNRNRWQRAKLCAQEERDAAEGGSAAAAATNTNKPKRRRGPLSAKAKAMVGGKDEAAAADAAATSSSSSSSRREAVTGGAEVRRLNVPDNIYSLGFWNNLKQVLAPPRLPQPVGGKQLRHPGSREEDGWPPVGLPGTGRPLKAAQHER